MKWYYESDGAQAGPVALSELKAMLADGSVAPSDKVWCKELSDWTPAAEVDALQIARVVEHPRQPTNSRAEPKGADTTDAETPSAAQTLQAAPLVEVPEPAGQSSSMNHAANAAAMSLDPNPLVERFANQPLGRHWKAIAAGVLVLVIGIGWLDINQQTAERTERYDTLLTETRQTVLAESRAWVQKRTDAPDSPHGLKSSLILGGMVSKKGGPDAHMKLVTIAARIRVESQRQSEMPGYQGGSGPWSAEALASARRAVVIDGDMVGGREDLAFMKGHFICVVDSFDDLDRARTIAGKMRATGLHPMLYDKGASVRVEAGY